MSTEARKKKPKRKQTRATKVNLVFDPAKRRDFLTGFHKRKVQRQKDAKEQFEKDLKEERKRIKAEAKESYKKLVVSHRPIPELETLLREEYDDDEVTVKVMELSTSGLAAENNWIGANQPTVKDESEDEADPNEISGMELTEKKVPKEKIVKRTFKSEKDVKKIIKREATKKVKKSKVFQLKNKMEMQKQKKKTMRAKLQKAKVMEKKKKHR